jgi:hypothetical protein
MTIIPATTQMTKIATSLGLTEDELFRQALISFLYEQKRHVLQLQLGMLARYDVNSITELESKIALGTVTEHPAWEDLIVTENLTARLEELDGYLNDLQGVDNYRAE